MKRARILNGPDGKRAYKAPAARTHRAVNLVIIVAILSLCTSIIYGGTWKELLAATVAIALLTAAWVLADEWQYKKRIRQMREETDRKREEQFRAPFDFHGER
jgi:hypothetical protein